MGLRRALSILATAALLGGGSLLLADGTQTGSIGGTIKDAGGSPLPGAQVTARGVKTGFVRTAISEADGTYTIRLMPPTDYNVEVSLSGFEKVSSVVTVYTERNTLFDATLKLTGVAQTISVTAELPVVDKTNTTQETNLNQSFTQKLAVGRSYQSLLQLAPGVTGGSNPNVHGSLSSTNVYLFDGVDTTDTTTGTFGQNFNYEAIQEVAVNTGSFSAEYGRATGAVVSVVTKSGTNEFHGSAKAILTNDDWNAQNYNTNEVTGVSLNRPIFDKIQTRYAFTLGGPILKDNLWFFGAYEKADITAAASQTRLGDNYQQTTKANIWAGKLTWQASPQHSFEAAGNGDPIDGFIVDYWGGSADAAALTSQDQGGKTFRGTWNGIFSSNLSAEATIASATSHIGVNTYQTNATAPFFVFNGNKVNTTQLLAPHQSIADGYYYNGATFTGFVDRPRTQFNIAANYYKHLGASNNNFKAGFDYQYLKSEASFAYPDNTVYIDDSFNKDTRQFKPNELQIYDAPAPSVSKGNIYGIYLLDRVDIGRFFANVGFRVDKQDGKSDIGKTTFDATVFSPRIYLKYDVAGNGKTLASAGYGRFYQSVIQNYSDGFAGVPQQTNYDDYTYNPATGKYDKVGRVDLSGNSQAINGDLKPSYTDDFNLKFEQQIGRVFGFSITGNYRKWNDLIDDVKTFQNGVRTVGFVNYGPAKRRYRGIELVVDKRFANSWQALVSYTLSRTEGNHFVDFSSALGDYLDNVGTGGLTGFQINEANKYGLASYDRTHLIKVYGSYVFNIGRVTLTSGLSLLWQSGQTYQRQRTLRVANTNFTAFDTERGSDRFPSLFQGDFALQADFRVFSEINVGLKGEVFNITDTQVKTGGSATNNANYGKATARGQFAAPRSLRLSAVINF